MPWTGVVRVKLICWAKSRIHCESSGVRASKDFGFFPAAPALGRVSEAMVVVLLCYCYEGRRKANFGGSGSKFVIS